MYLKEQGVPQITGGISVVDSLLNFKQAKKNDFKQSKFWF